MAMLISWEQDRQALSGIVDAHDPSLCMPAIGGVLDRRMEPVMVSVQGRDLRFDAYVFVTHGRRQYVFNAVWDATRNGRVTATGLSEGIVSKRLRRVLERRRFTDLDRVVMVGQDAVDEVAARRWLQREVPLLLSLPFP
ncbi:MAG: hypothetical protein J6386_07250 [Candidatus Synoicihabitans palmerolidicus]|nr:hypothetical protein [Candidatus Synoicihabitans palmerolidicus]